MSGSQVYDYWLYAGRREDGWMALAACRSIAADEVDRIFFPSLPVGARMRSATARHAIREAQLICKECPVKRECGLYALRHHITDGVWGGMSSAQRNLWWRQHERSAG